MITEVLPQGCNLQMTGPIPGLWPWLARDQWEKETVSPFFILRQARCLKLLVTLLGSLLALLQTTGANCKGQDSLSGGNVSVKTGRLAPGLPVGSGHSLQGLPLYQEPEGRKTKIRGMGGGWKPGGDLRGGRGGLRKCRRQGNKEQR